MRFAGEEYAPVASGGKRISNVTGASVRRGGPAKKISDMSAKVGVIMGSASDWEVMAAAAETFHDDLHVDFIDGSGAEIDFSLKLRQYKGSLDAHDV